MLSASQCNGCSKTVFEYLSMYQYGRGIRLLSSASTSSRSFWDPTVALELNHLTLALLEKCRTRYHFKQILGQMMRTCLIGQTFPMSRLLTFSAISYPDNLDIAVLLFNHYTPCPNLYIYNCMISALSFSKSQSFGLYKSMLYDDIYPDKNTLLYLLRASKNLSDVKQIHCHAIVTGLLSQGYLQNSLIKMYMEKGQMELSHLVFHHLPTPDRVSFNIMIVGYARKEYFSEALQLFYKMMDLGLKPDDFTILGLLMSCGGIGDARLGMSVHAWIERRETITSNLILVNALLDMYVKFNKLETAQNIFNALEEKDIVSWNTMTAGYAKVGNLELAHNFFKQMPRRDLVSWNSLISGYAKRGEYDMVIKVFHNMVTENVRPDNITLVNLVSAAAEIGALDKGKWMHGLILRMQMKIDAFLGSALIDMYCKAGSLERAFLVFRELTEKDVTVWTTLITGFAFHGHGRKGLDLFSEMQRFLLPNGVTIVAVLTGCSHSGLVEEGLSIFNSMKKKFDIDPGIEHYGCLVDLFCRSGRLVEAKDVIENMPIQPSRSIWGAMLSACRVHGNMELAEIASTELLKLEPEKEGGYILLSNIYAACGRWSSSDKIREIMETKGVKKTAGCSSVVVDGVIHDFVAADKRHPRWEDIFHILLCLKSEMKLDETDLANFALFTR
ncbi:PREDICTED: pentatricopeptide repeat-containing protein At3g04750, mitochondrial-like [Fragaria vesca subsp. vesca]|uniref:pentatricopeptide repeat-containing protein At3g04750, mitochondrial n=1 Tax=Fragaria vesca subsp. vesca TaxID=101020 RepID=UPI0002C3067B|nr:PREDICTED: pentatricopeptide repeat-containing protein At3g04750, mitochondrial [Fragaria vesca subsp. vesca]XP_011465957.1 PREDICTED: pentatricopeptide repeat-containing protein At3g04750, mitochondrial [Fragaria vesca subsp. vesca]